MRAGITYRIAVAVLILLWIVPSRFYAQETDYKAYSLFVYNFIKYIEWPEPADNFVIGVLGDSPIQKELEILAKSKKAKGRPIIIKKISTAEEALTCQMVYITPGKSSMLKAVIEKTKGKPILLLGEREGLAKKGAGLSFVTMDDDTLKFEFNQSALEQNKLKIPGVLSKLGLST